MLMYLMLASPVRCAKNIRFCQDLKAMIKEHPERHILKSKKAKLDALGYQLNI